MTEPDPRVARVVAFMALVITVVAVAAETILQRVVVEAVDDRSLLEHVLLSGVFIAFVVNGLVLLWHRPRNPVGWVLLGIGGSAVWTAPMTAWGEHLLATGRAPDAWGLLGLWVNGWYFPLLLAAVTFYLPVLFPDGRLPSPRWWPVTWVVSVPVGLLVLMGMTAPRLEGQDADVAHANPLGIAWMPATEGSLVGDTLFLAMLVGLGAGVTALVVRFRRSRGPERQQLKLLLAAASLLPLLPLSEWAAPFLGVPEDLRVLLFPVVLACLPTAITVAVLRHRLWDIDRIVSRTLSYVVLVGVLAAVYLGAVLGLGAAARTVTGESGDLVVALSTLAVAAAFQPVRRRVRSAVDRRFNRSGYDAARTIESYGRALRDEVDAATILTGLRGTTAATFGASSVGVVVVGQRGTT